MNEPTPAKSVSETAIYVLIIVLIFFALIHFSWEYTKHQDLKEHWKLVREDCQRNRSEK